MIDTDENKRPWPFFKMNMETKVLNTGGKKQSESQSLYSIQKLVKQKRLNPHLFVYSFSLLQK